MRGGRLMYIRMNMYSETDRRAGDIRTIRRNYEQVKAKRQTDRRTDRHTERRADRQTNRDTE